MLLELIDSLRCPNDHAETPLVCVAHRSRDRDLEEGVLGCPVCRAEFTVRNGVARFGDTPRDAPPAPPDARADDAFVLRVAALLDLRAPGGVVALSAGIASCAPRVAEQTEVHALVVNVAAPKPGLVSALCGVRTLPLAAGSLRGAVLDELAETLLASTARAVRVGGRLVAPSAWALPDDYRELARDGRAWVAEHDAVRTRPIPLRVAR